jgi:predicted acetyltransferase
MVTQGCRKTGCGANHNGQSGIAWASKYCGCMPELILPTTDLHAAFLDCRDEWGPGLHEDGFGLGAGDDVDSVDGFAAWVRKRVRLVHAVGTPCPAEKHGSPRWIVEDGKILGGIALRHIFDDDIGHIGYGVRPSARRRGLAGWALGEMLAEARAALAVNRVLIPCLADNVASARTIERNGGVLECIRDTQQGPVRRYWITLDR